MPCILGICAVVERDTLIYEGFDPNLERLKQVVVERNKSIPGPDLARYEGNMRCFSTRVFKCLFKYQALDFNRKLGEETKGLYSVCDHR